MCWHPLSRKLQRSKKMSNTPTPQEAAGSGLSRHALFGMLRADEPEYKKTVLVAFQINDKLTWGVGVFISLGAELWFRYDGTHQGIPIHTPGSDTPMVGWMYLPSAEADARRTDQ
jgi:hypothetical protein